MQIKNTENCFGIVAIFLHWVMALLIVGLLCVGLYMTRIPVSLSKLKLYGWHKEYGMLVLMLAVVRITWRWRNINPSLASLSRFEEFAARSVHWAFYVFMFALPITGWLITSAASLPVSFFGLFIFPNIVSPSEQHRILFQEIHRWLAYA